MPDNWKMLKRFVEETCEECVHYQNEHCPELANFIATGKNATHILIAWDYGDISAYYAITENHRYECRMFYKKEAQNDEK